VIIMSLAFLFSLVSLASFPWNLVPESWGIATVVFSVLTGFSTIMVAYFVYEDRGYADWVYARMLSVEDRFEKRIKTLEGIAGVGKSEKAQEKVRPPPPKNPYYSDSARTLLEMREEPKDKNSSNKTNQG